ncbi:ribosome biogenesis GTPase Der [Buchnera aphidicola (Takecallis taiwana)]|uniref:ribosome biogenesis GTPase Der n=1 Tax=Buchnera aphidicola TaxID=9 RepID=UPI0031B6CE4A
MIFNIVLVGQTNVGKSTLFNKLINKNVAIVHHTINFTRDRQYGILHLKNSIVNLIDTAGIQLDTDNNNIQKSILNQTFIAIREASLVLFVFNMKTGITEADKILLHRIRKQSKTIFIIINKIDTIQDYQYKFSEYFCFGIKEIFLISALKSLGISRLKNKIQIWYNQHILLPGNISCNNIIKKTNSNVLKNIMIALIGKPNVGKSTLFNALLKKQRAVTCNIPGTTRDSITDTIIFQKQKYVIMDTAGVRKKNNTSVESLSILKTLHAIANTHISILIVDYTDGFNKQDLWLLNVMIQSGKKILILINKSEKLSIVEKNKIRNYLYYKYKIIHCFYIHFISALYQIGIKKIFFLINKLNNNINFIMKSSELTKIMYQAIQEYPPKVIRGKQIKLQYAHPGGYNPPTIVIHGNQLMYISKNYKRYLINFFQDRLHLFGSIIKIIFKNKSNPYMIR